MAGKSRCEQCGAELPPDAPQNLCPQCLMKLGLPTGAGVGKARSSTPRTSEAWRRATAWKLPSIHGRGSTTLA